MAPNRRDPRRLLPRGSTQSGFSLLEVLLASALLLVIVVSVLPLFTRALASNTTGGRASTMSAFATGNVEAVNQAVLNHPDFDLVGQTCMDATDPCLDLGSEYWKVTDATEIDGAGWQDTYNANDLVLWNRTTKIRKFTVTDIGLGDFAIGGGGLAPRGHPELYDRPLDDDDGAAAKNVHLLEVRVTVQPQTGLPLSQGQQMTIGQFRVF